MKHTKRILTVLISLALTAMTGTTALAVNNGAVLPDTGGIGTTIFYIVGGLLVVGAIVVMISRKRMSDDSEE